MLFFDGYGANLYNALSHAIQSLYRCHKRLNVTPTVIREGWMSRSIVKLVFYLSLWKQSILWPVTPISLLKISTKLGFIDMYTV